MPSGIPRKADWKAPHEVQPGNRRFNEEKDKGGKDKINVVLQEGDVASIKTIKEQLQHTQVQIIEFK